MEVHQILSQYFEKMKRSNPRLSTRYLAKNLGISASHASMILSGHRAPSLTLLSSLAKLLDIEAETFSKLRKTLLERKVKSFKNEDDYLISQNDTPKAVSEKSKQPQFILATKNQFVALKSWHYLAIEKTTLLSTFDGTAKFISRFLDFPLPLVLECVNELVAAGILSQDPESENLKSTCNYSSFQSGNRSKFTEWHISNIEDSVKALKGKKKGSHLDDRLVTGALLTCNRAAIPALRQKLSQFLLEFTSSIEDGEHDELCRIGIQLLPLSASEIEE